MPARVSCCCPIGLPDHHQPIDVCQRHRPQSNRVDDAENRRRHAYPQREGEDRHDLCESRDLSAACEARNGDRRSMRSLFLVRSSFSFLPFSQQLRQIHARGAPCRKKTRDEAAGRGDLDWREHRGGTCRPNEARFHCEKLHFAEGVARNAVLASGHWSDRPSTDRTSCSPCFKRPPNSSPC